MGDRSGYHLTNDSEHDRIGGVTRVRESALSIALLTIRSLALTAGRSTTIPSTRPVPRHPRPWATAGGHTHGIHRDHLVIEAHERGPVPRVKRDLFPRISLKQDGFLSCRGLEHPPGRLKRSINAHFSGRFASRKPSP